MTTLAELHEQDLLEGMHQEIARETPLPSAPHAAPGFFSNVLLEVDSTERRRRKWSAFSSLMLQSLMLAGLLIIPLLFTEALPKAQLLTFLVAPPPPPPPPPPAAPAPAQVIRRVESNMTDGRLRTPTRIPEKVQMIREEEAPPQLNYGGGVVGGVEGGIPGGQLGGVIGGIISSTSHVSVVPKLAAPVIPKRVRVSSGVVAGMVINKIEPAYPVIAKAARIQGDVVLTAIISKRGTVENVQVESGHPLLVKAALDAVQQWRYRPFVVSGEPVEVETKIVVTFRFAQ
jgi:protein TonB